MSLSVVRISGGAGSLGPWGSLRLTGASSAVIKTTECEDIEVPTTVAEDRPDGIIVLNEAMGRLLFLPYRGETIAGFDLTDGKALFPPIVIPRDEDEGMRVPDFRIIEDGGVAYLTEASLMRFGEDLMLAWRRDEDFGRWEFEGVSYREIRLTSLDLKGREEQQIWNLEDGRRLALPSLSRS